MFQQSTQLKGEHKKPEHVKAPPVVEQKVEETTEQSGPIGQIASDVAELPASQEMTLQKCMNNLIQVILWIYKKSIHQG